MNYFGDIPANGFICLTSCDSKYLREHAAAYLASANQVGNNVHLHVVNASESDWAQMHVMRLACKNITITLSSEETDLSQFDSESIRTYYACNRFIVANYLKSNASVRLFISDIDCLFLKKIEEPNADLGLFLRDPLPGVDDWEKEGSRIAAGSVYYGVNTENFAFDVAKIITHNPLRWFLDQYALNVVYNMYSDRLKLHRYESDFMDWEFLPNSSIWTGKGDRKNSNQVYLKQKKIFSTLMEDYKKKAYASVIILKPRLDVMFKKGPTPSQRGPIEPIREHWNNMVEVLSRLHENAKIIELPLWQFTPALVEELNPNLVYIPHKEVHNFPVKCKAKYYMQMVFPWMFSLDEKGWCAGASVYPYNNLKLTLNNHFDDLAEYALTNSKFDQPNIHIKNLPKDYVFFPAQLLHDQTILYHSNVGVESALIQTIEACRELKMHIVIKPHPVNPNSMKPLYEIAKKYDFVHWIEKASIQQLIKESRVVVTVNSGVGVEALLQKRPVITFGRSDYDSVSNRVVGNNLKELLINPKFDEDRVRMHINSWVEWLYDSSGGR